MTAWAPEPASAWLSLMLLGKQLGCVLAAVESATELFRPHHQRSKKLSPQNQWEALQKLPLVTVT